MSGQEPLRVVMGPSYLELESMANIDWRGAIVRYLKKEAPKQPPAAANIIVYDAASIAKGISSRPVSAALSRFILRLNADRDCYLLAERERRSLFDGAFLASVEIANCARYAWSLFEDFGPDVLIFHNLPHDLFAYVLLQLALHLETPVLVVHYSALPWRMAVSKYLPDGTLERLKTRDVPTDAERASVRSYLARLRGVHDKAIPYTDRSLVSAKGSPLSFGEELRAGLRGGIIKNCLRVLLKSSMYRQFRTFVSPEVRRPYVAFFLHYQPEETTIPRGGFFSQQLNAILSLRALLPASVNIVVKENKAMFRLPFTLAIKVRNEEFYRTIATLPGTSLVPLHFDTFDLVDGALAVATITGSVGLEALCRGKRTIIFGLAMYQQFSGVTRVTGAPSDAAALADVLLHPTHDPAQTERDLLLESTLTIGSTEDHPTENLQSQRAATVEAFEYIAAEVHNLIARTGPRFREATAIS